MTKPFLTFDVDGTIFKSSLAEKIVERGTKEGLFDADAFNAVHANRRRWQTNNNEGIYLAYLNRLVGTLITQMEGVEVERFDATMANMLDEHINRKFKFARTILRSLRTTHIPVAISGSPEVIVRPFLADLNIPHIYGSTYEIENSVFTGIAQSVGDKALLLQKLVNSGVVSQEGSVAVGDTFSDVPMLSYAAQPTMFNPSHTLTTYGEEFGWPKVIEVKDQVTVLTRHLELGIYTEQDLDDFIASLQSTALV